MLSKKIPSILLSPAINLFQSSLVISLSISHSSKSCLRKLIVRSGGCCEEILVPVKIAYSDGEIQKRKTIDFFPILRIGRRIYVYPQLPFNPHTSANWGFLHWEAAKEEWAHTLVR